MQQEGGPKADYDSGRFDDNCNYDLFFEDKEATNNIANIQR